MFYWPHCELTEYEKKFVSLYKTDKKPGVLRRAYRVILNSIAVENVPLLEVSRLSGRVQISRRSRVFALSFAGDTANWRLTIQTASGERFTGVNPGAPQNTSAFPGADESDSPIVASMCPGSFFSPVSSLGIPPVAFSADDGEEDATLGLVNQFQLPLDIEPNWELVPNEVLIFDGVPINGQTLKVLEIMVHVWEFEDWEKEC